MADRLACTSVIGPAVDTATAPGNIPAPDPSGTAADCRYSTPGGTAVSRHPFHVEGPIGLVSIPGYELRGELARGGMGRVLAATDLAFGREVAIKVVLPGPDATAAAGRFVREARITGRLAHPGIPLADTHQPALDIPHGSGRKRAAEWRSGMRQRLAPGIFRPGLPLAVACCLLLAPPGRAAEPGLVFSVRTWEGEYASRDVPGGVESTPTVGSISSINADGTGLKRVVPPGAGVDYPVASRDGQWVYYQAGTRGNSQIYRCRWDGTGATSLTRPEHVAKAFAGAGGFGVKEAFGYALSADGTRMVFSAHDGTSGRVVTAAADGSSPAPVASHLGYIYMARLSPTNDRVVFSGPARGYRLQLAALPDGRPVELTPDHPECFVPQFTPDGATVVFVRRDGDVYRVGTDGKNFKRLTEGNRYVEFRLSPKDRHGSTDGPDLSPDGKRIAFIAVVDGVPNVFVVDLDGGNRRQVTTRATPCGRVKWSPDGRHLSFVSFEGKYPQLFVVPSAGGAVKQLTRLDGGVNFAHWKPE
ncbi:MAG TPA: hypothetical protein VH092_19665 [Urbifossiella sp.]|jgi:hypothetical protein|nr:hypothetical protein [Urbifossiella sp.]